MKTVKNLVSVILGLIMLWSSAIVAYATNEASQKDEQDTGYIEAKVTVPEGFAATITIIFETEDGKEYPVELEAKNKYKTNEKIPVGKYLTNSIDIDDANKYIIERPAEIIIEKDQKTAYSIRIRDRKILEKDSEKEDTEDIIPKDRLDILGKDADMLKNGQESLAELVTPDGESSFEGEENPKEKIDAEDKEKSPKQPSTVKKEKLFYILLKNNKYDLIIFAILCAVLGIIKAKNKYF
jgi:hypothetical protein